LLLPIVLLAAAVPAGAKAETVFQCSFGKKQVLVTRAGALYLYSFGAAGRPEIQVVGDPKRRNVFVSPEGSMGTMDGDKYLRITNGRYSYVVFFEGLTKEYETERAMSHSGLKVFDGLKRISVWVPSQLELVEFAGRGCRGPRQPLG